jgi:predicted house-cleaning NTP pyrophosphatase (Maf/HAM1 superfamily)
LVGRVSYRYLAEAGDILTKGVGAYAFEGLGAQLFEKVEGDFFSILGLPLACLCWAPCASMA